MYRVTPRVCMLLATIIMTPTSPIGPGCSNDSAQDDASRADGSMGDSHGETAPSDAGPSRSDAVAVAPSAVCADDAPAQARPAGWTRASHCKGVAADYDRLFDDNTVHRFDITIGALHHEAAMADLAEKLSGGGPGGAGGFDNPIWVPVTLAFDGLTWTHVGMRYKGNSSLKSAYSSGIRKLSFRLNFDKYEDAHPETDNQRLFGFKKMTFSNGFKDPSLIRDKLAADIFREGGVPAARGAFARVYVDFGEGSVYFGLYTMIEDPSDDMLTAQFGDDDGNLYKPEGTRAKWGRFDPESFVKKSNEDDSDWRDIIAAIDALHADPDDVTTWRAGLEATFDVHGFLTCLAINQVMVNWDSYGFMSHNYYLYGDPDDGGRLRWFPWDLNEAMLTPRSRGGADPSSVLLDEVTLEWPLIRRLLDDPVYRQIYRDELTAALAGTFAIDRVHARIDAYHALISPYVVGADGETRPYSHLRDSAEFEGSLTARPDALKPHVEARHLAVNEALEAQLPGPRQSTSFQIPTQATPLM